MDDQSALDDFRGRFGESKVADSKRQTLVEVCLAQWAVATCRNKLMGCQCLGSHRPERQACERVSAVV